MEITIILALIFFTVLALFRLNWGLFIIIFSLPIYLIRFNIGPFPSTMLEFMILIVFLVWLFKDKPWKNLKRKVFKKRIKYPYYLEIIGLLIAAWFGLLIANFSPGALGIFKAYFIEPIMLYLVLVNRAYINIKKFIWPLSLSALIISLVAILQQYLIGFDLSSIMQTKVSSIFSYPNALGLFLGPIILLSTGLFLSYPKRANLFISIKKLIIILSIGLSILAIFFAQSDGALVAVIASFFLLGLLANKKSRKVAIISIILITLAISLHQPSWQYIKTRGTLMDLSGQIRRQQWKETKDMLFDGRIISGAGLDNYQTSLKKYHQEGIFVKDINDPEWHRKVVWDKEYHKEAWQPVEIYLYPHNIFLNFWTEITLIGALLFIWLILKVLFDLLKLLKRLVPKHKAIALGVIGSLVTILIHGLVDVPYFKNDLSVLFWIIIFFAASIKLKNKKTI
jgi:O-antigen ligase